MFVPGGGVSVPGHKIDHAPDGTGGVYRSAEIHWREVSKDVGAMAREENRSGGNLRKRWDRKVISSHAAKLFGLTKLNVSIYNSNCKPV